MSNPLPSLVLLVRHGATEWSVSGRHTGRTDLPLTPLGVAQAAAVQPVLQRLLEGQQPLVFTSPLRRAHQTAQLALPGASLTAVDSLMELDYGQYEGLLTSEILERDPQWNLFEHGCPQGEQPAQFERRCDSFVELLQHTAPGRAVVAFTHGHLSRVLTARLLGLPVDGGGAVQRDGLGQRHQRAPRPLGARRVEHPVTVRTVRPPWGRTL